ncbi:MAG: type II toxin-antitoxin system RelE/ParE family toxin [Acidobacteriia bacterium]|nr:type II toxin-antitoxin system RelE/ParE family toxin [Terriglobia bacterium]
MPLRDRQRILRALASMQQEPFSGDVARLQGQPLTWRRRVGSYRIFFDIHRDSGLIDILEIVRRTSVTY